MKPCVACATPAVDDCAKCGERRCPAHLLGDCAIGGVHVTTPVASLHPHVRDGLARELDAREDEHAAGDGPPPHPHAATLRAELRAAAARDKR